MKRDRIDAGQRAMIENRLRRRGGARAVAALAVFALVGAIALGSAIFRGEDESYQFHAPDSLEEGFRTETIAVAPATGASVETGRPINDELYG